MVDFYVGSTREHFHIHQQLLTQWAPLFSSMFKSGFKESLNKSADLPEDDPPTFDRFVQWVYVRTLPEIGLATSSTISGPVWDQIKLYCFAEKYCIDILADTIIDSIRVASKSRNSCPSVQGMIMAYENTSEGSRLRLYMVRSLAYEILSERSENLDKSQLSSLASVTDFSRDILMLLFEPKNLVPKHPNEFPACDYHRHGKNNICNRHLRIKSGDLASKVTKPPLANKRRRTADSRETSSSYDSLTGLLILKQLAVRPEDGP